MIIKKIKRVWYNNKFKVSIRRNYIYIKTIKKFNAIFLSYKTNTKKIIGHLNKKNVGKRN